jgi:hypothetical protein
MAIAAADIFAGRSMSARHEIMGLFPTPLMRAPSMLPSSLVAALVEHFSATVSQPNNSSANLSHTSMLRPGDSTLLVDVARLVTPLLAEFGL